MITPTPVITVYAESTPNPDAMKFVCNKGLVKGNSVEFTNQDSAQVSPFATELFKFPFVTGVFISGNYVTITKIKGLDWNEIILELREFIKSYISSGKKILAERIETSGLSKAESNPLQKDTFSDIEIKIMETLDEYIKPAVEQDGGAIVFKSFNEGIVTVVMKGACSGCPSSAYTLKAGIEGLLKRLIPGVTEVIAEQD